MDAVINRKCLQCEEPFQAVDRRQKHCTEDCRLELDRSRSVRWKEAPAMSGALTDRGFL
jgi:hypothetical protein